MSGYLRDFKKYTSKACMEVIQTTLESRREFLLDKIGFEAYITRRAEQFKVWQDVNHPILLQTPTSWVRASSANQHNLNLKQNPITTNKI